MGILMSGNPHLGNDGAVDIFHHGMNHALRMDLDDDFFTGY